MNLDKKDGGEKASVGQSEIKSTWYPQQLKATNDNDVIEEESSECHEPGLMRSKPSREIYKPPNLRKSRSYHYQNGKPKGQGKNFSNVLYYQSIANSSSGQSDPASDSDQFVAADQRQFLGFQARCINPGSNGQSQQPNLNVNAKEFKAHPNMERNEYQSQQKYNWTKPGNAESRNQGARAVPLPQSKSTTSMFTQFQKHCRQLEEQKEQERQLNRSDSSISFTSQSGTSNGNLSFGKGRVRFFDEKQPGNGSIENQFKSLKIEATKNEDGFTIPRSQPFQAKKPELVRSRSMLYKSPSEPCAPSPPFNKKLWDAFHPSPIPNSQGWTPNWSFPGKIQETWKNPAFGGLKRSKSFGARTVQPLIQGDPAPISSKPSAVNWDDFQLSKWPKGVVESVMMAMNGVERVPARHRINMVTRIFGTILGDYGTSLTVAAEEHKTLTQYILPAVHIFFYFIQRESDQTVLESFLNNALITYQSLFQGSKVTSKKPNGQAPVLLMSFSTTSKWIIFLQLLSTFYQKTKVIRVNRQRSLDEFSQRLLSLLCNSSLVVLRLLPISYTAELVDTLFTVMTSLGRDMETRFPLKMKEILASVRDVLLGVTGSTQGGPSAQVHKTLMQLIELHAANWQLPASAVRYYYANSNNNTNQAQHLLEN